VTVDELMDILERERLYRDYSIGDFEVILTIPGVATRSLTDIVVTKDLTNSTAHVALGGTQSA
jgi:hypothetical protein